VRWAGGEVGADLLRLVDDGARPADAAAVQDGQPGGEAAHHRRHVRQSGRPHRRRAQPHLGQSPSRTRSEQADSFSLFVFFLSLPSFTVFRLSFYTAFTFFLLVLT